MVEQRTENPRVGCSIHPLGTIFPINNSYLRDVQMGQGKSLTLFIEKFDTFSPVLCFPTCESQNGQDDPEGLYMAKFFGNTYLWFALICFLIGIMGWAWRWILGL